MLIVMACVLFLIAYFAEPIVEEYPVYSRNFGGIRGFVDDFSAGDPIKIVKYESTTGIITSLNGGDSANVKYSIKGYIYQGGVTARNEQERRILRTSAVGNGMVIYYDPVNTTIAVMQPTYLEAQRRIKGMRSSTEPARKKPKFMPGYGHNPRVEYVRLGSLIMGMIFLVMGVRTRRDDD